MKCPACNSENWKVEGEEIYCIAHKGILGVCFYHLNEYEKWQYKNEKQTVIKGFEPQKPNHTRIKTDKLTELIKTRLGLIEKDKICGLTMEEISKLGKLEKFLHSEYFAIAQHNYRERKKEVKRKEKLIEEPELFS